MTDAPELQDRPASHLIEDARREAAFHRACSRAFRAAGVEYDSTAHLLSALLVAAEASGDSTLDEAFRSAAEHMYETGAEFTESLERTRVFPPDVIARLRQDISHRLPHESFLDVASACEEKARDSRERLLDLLTQLVPRLERRIEILEQASGRDGSHECGVRDDHPPGRLTPR